MGAVSIGPGGTAHATSREWHAEAHEMGHTATASTYVRVVMDPYEGPYEVTPSATEQVMPTSGKTMERDLTIGPIPSNYGLVTWTGAVLTVS